MAKKDKKAQAAKKARVAEKTSKKLASKEKKASSKSKNAAEVDPDDQDIDSVLASYAAAQAAYLKVTETVLSEPPSVRANATLVPHPANDRELILFGGELFDGAKASFFNDLFVYHTTRNEWRQVTSPNSPLPRSGHFMCPSGGKSGVGGGRAAVWLFGGEFSSPKQGTFYHYGDLWRLDCDSPTKTLEWEKIETKSSTKGKSGPSSPPARSGHRMVAWRNFIVLFGGFQDTSQNTKYLNDVWLFDTTNYTWLPVVLPTHAQKPDPRSSFSLLPHEAGAVLYGGYSRVKPPSAPSSTRKSASSGISTKPVVHQDTWLLRISPESPGTLTRWERRKKPGNPPNPPRVGVTMASHRGRGIMFGGVADTERDEEGLESEFFDGLFAWGVERNRFFPLVLRKPRQQGQGGKTGGERGGGRRDRAKEDEAELLANLARLEGLGSDTTASTPTTEQQEEEEEKAPEMPLSLQLPAPRFNASLAVQNDTLYIYGGTIERADREIVYDEMHSIDLGKLDGVRTVFMRTDTIEWVDSESEDESDDEDDEDDEEEEEEEEEEDGEIDPKKAAIAKEIEEGRERKRLLAEAAAAAAEEDTSDAQPEDTLPFPRPFEALRDFFARTTNEWQEMVLRDMSVSGDTTAGQGGTIKDLRKIAFSRAETRWWDVREEVREMEDERLEAGVGEVVALGEKGGAGGGGAGGAPRRR